MASATRLYRLQLAVAALGGAAVALALAVALTRVDFRLASLDALAEACRGMGLAELSAASLAVLALGGLAVTVAGLGVRSALRQRRATRRYLCALERADSAAVAGHAVLVTDEPRPYAFCSGLLAPRVYVSRGALDLLGAAELGAVVAHEAHHARRRDPLRLFVARTLADALFFLPVARRLAERYAALAELAADEAAVRQTGGRRPLAAALLAFEDAPSAAVVAVSPERVDHLLGARPRSELPALLAVAGALTLALLLLLVAQTASATGTGSVGIPALLAQACMVAMAAAAVAAASAALLAARRALGRRRG